MASRSSTQSPDEEPEPADWAQGSIPAYLAVPLAIVLIVGIVVMGKPVIVPLALAMLFAFVLTPLVVRVQRWGVGRVPAVLLVGGVTFLIFAVVAWGAGTEVAKLSRELPAHAGEIRSKLATLHGAGWKHISRMTEIFDSSGTPASEHSTGPATMPVTAPTRVVIASDESGGLTPLFSIGSTLLEPLADAGLVVILVIFMLIRREDLRNRVIGLLGHGRLTGTTRVFVGAAERLSSYLLMQLAVNSAFGLICGLMLWVVGVPYWFLWGFLTVLLRFVPYVGTWAAAAMPVLLSFAISPGWSQPLLVLGLFILFDLVTANVIEPLLFGHSTGVSALALLVAALFWTWAWGPLGLVLSTPLTVCLVVLGQHVPHLRFLSLLLGDQPALAVHASYYQRLLAGDRNEAGALLKEYGQRSGADHIPDDVLIPALQLTRHDRDLDGLNAEDESFIFDTTRDLVKSWIKPRAVPAAAEGGANRDAELPPLMFGIPAHHRGEELVLEMLSGVIDPAVGRLQNMTTRMLPREIESRVERDGPAVLFIAVLPPGGVTQARYLCRRLRKRFPELPIVVAYFGKVKDFDRLLLRLRAAGASYVTTSLLQSRSQILALLGTAAARPVETGAIQ